MLCRKIYSWRYKLTSYPANLENQQQFDEYQTQKHFDERLPSSQIRMEMTWNHATNGYGQIFYTIKSSKKDKILILKVNMSMTYTTRRSIERKPLQKSRSAICWSVKEEYMFLHRPLRQRTVQCLLLCRDKRLPEICFKTQIVGSVTFS